MNPLRFPLKIAFCPWPLLIAGALSASAAPDGPSTGLVGWWSFEDCDGRFLRDRSPLGNDGVIEDGVIRQEKAGSSLELGGIGAHLLIRPEKPFGFTSELTAAIWVRPAALRHRTVLFGVPNSNPEWTTPMFGMYVDQERVVFGLWGSPGSAKVLVESPGSLALDVWTFLAGTYDGERVRLFVNGEAVAELPHRGTIVDNGLPLMIGKGLGSAKPSFEGRFGELRLYARALPAEEVRELFRATGGAFDLTPPPPPRFRDGVVTVETHGRSPEDSKPWRGRPTRLLELLDGYQAGDQPVPVNAYGGRLDRPQENGTGFFRVMKIGPRNWLIDPEGCRFYKIGINTVREPRNVSAHFGSPEQWAATVTGQLRDAGFNGLGNWSSSLLRELPEPLVWVLRINFMFEFARQKKLTVPASGTVGFIDGCMPVFHPDFESFCETMARDLAATAGDPFLLGIMTDNELQCRPDLLDRFLTLDASHPDLRPGREAARAWLAERRGDGGEKDITQRERYEFIAFTFDRYYRVVTAAIRRHDPHHLYLGSRINYSSGQFDNPFFWKVLARYHDVVSVNYYNDWGPQARQCAEWAEWSGGLPILFTEWYAKAMDAPELANTRGAGWLVRTQEDRARYYQHFALNALEIPTVVGWHWFKYLDDPAESTALDSAGGANKGMFDLEGKPYRPLLERARVVNREAYRLIDFFDRRNEGRP